MLLWKTNTKGRWISWSWIAKHGISISASFWCRLNLNWAQEIQPLLFSHSLFSPSVSPLCVNAVVLFCVSVACPLSRSPWWRGGCVGQILLSDDWSCAMFSWTHPSLVFYNLHFCHHNCIYYDLLIYSVHMTSIVCMSILAEGSSVALPEVSSIFFPVKTFFFPYPNWGSKDRWCCMLYRL